MTARKKIATLKTNKKIKVFLIFLLLSSLFWFFSTLSDDYSYLTEFSLKFKDVPKNMVFQKPPSKSILAQIETSGFTILGHKLSNKELTISFDEFKHSKDYTYYYLPGNHITRLQKQLSDTKIIRFTQDTITIYLGKLKTKKVPVKLNVNLLFKPGFKLTEKLIVNPDSIAITGAEKIIDSIKSISTESSKIVEIDKHFEERLTLKSPSDKIDLEKTNCIVSGEVAKFTEGSVEVPIQINNLPKNIQIELFPKTAVINYEVTFENYPKINDKSFVVSCDYLKNNTKNKEMLPLKVTKKPDYITNFSIQTKEVNYLIKK
jgi:hypothetical protein